LYNKNINLSIRVLK